MSYRGHVKNGVVLLDEPSSLPEGAEVNVELVASANQQGSTPPSVREFAGMLADLSDSEWESYRQAVKRRALFAD
jgi:hypothetical protein